MADDSLKNDLLNQMRTHEEKITGLKKQKSIVVAELKQRQAVVKTIRNQLAKLDGTAPKKHKQSKPKKSSEPKPVPPSETSPSAPSQLQKPTQQGPSGSETTKNLVQL